MKMMRLFTILTFFTTIVLAPLAARADGGDAGSNAADFLRLGASARAAAQGEAFTGRGGVIEGLHYNPASIARMDSCEVTFQHDQYMLDMSSNYLALALPFSKFSLGLSVLSVDNGKFTRRTISNPNGTGTFEASSFAGSLSAAFGLTDDLSFGATAKGFNESIDDEDRSGAAFDLGLHYRISRSFELGLAARNLGASVRYDREKEGLPREFAAGFSVLTFKDRLRLSSEIVLPRHQSVDLKAGVELRIVGPLSLRGGYDSRNELGPGWSAGAGFTFRNLTLDYAYVPFGDARDAHRIGLSWRFGGVKRPAEEIRYESSVISESMSEASRPGSSAERGGVAPASEDSESARHSMPYESRVISNN